MGQGGAAAFPCTALGGAGRPDHPAAPSSCRVSPHRPDSPAPAARGYARPGRSLRPPRRRAERAAHPAAVRRRRAREAATAARAVLGARCALPPGLGPPRRPLSSRHVTAGGYKARAARRSVC